MESCKNCGSPDIRDLGPIEDRSKIHQYECRDCGHVDTVKLEQLDSIYTPRPDPLDEGRWHHLMRRS